MTPYRHTLSRRESSQRNHVNADMARRRQHQITKWIDRVEVERIARVLAAVLPGLRQSLSI